MMLSCLIRSRFWSGVSSFPPKPDLCLLVESASLDVGDEDTGEDAVLSLAQPPASSGRGAGVHIFCQGTLRPIQLFARLKTSIQSARAGLRAGWNKG